MRGDPLWGVLIGLEDRGEMAAGVVHLPMLGQTCWAARGGGAFRNRRAVAGFDDQGCVVRGTDGERADADPRDAVFRAVDRFREPLLAFRCLGGTPDAMMLAAGETDAWIEPMVHEWDLAAAQVILEEAGAKFFSFGGKRTIYDANAIACTPGLEAELRAFFCS